MIKLSFANLKLRKLRTVLTILGIMIGIMSLVTMLTVGLSAKKAMLEMVERMGSTREINVESNKTTRRDRLLNDKLINKIEELDGVEGVYPVLEVSGSEKLRTYIGWSYIVGVPHEYMELLSIETGDYPDSNGARPELMVGKGVRYILFNEKTYSVYMESAEGSNSLAGQKIDFTLEESIAESPEEDNEEEEEEVIETASAGDAKKDKEEETEEEEESSEDNKKTYKLSIVGETDNEYDYNIYTDIDTLKIFLKRSAVNNKIPGQPLDKYGKSYPTWVYNRLIVRVKDLEDVDRVSEVLKDMGYQVSNNKEALESTEKTLGTIQMILAAVGTIAALVAVIGIINTMMTAVYDRIREISLLKMLGADSDDIRFMFLFESAFMGFVGGVLGVILSMLVGLVINGKLVKLMEMPEGSYIMNTPIWLVAAAIILSLVVAVLASLFPTSWAVKLKPLEGMAKE